MVGIKDFEMPPHCFVCPMCNANNPNRSSVALGTPFTCDITENALLDVHNIRDKDCPLVEAIPKDQYEARLKADLVAILTEIQLEIEENSYSENVYGDGYGIDKVISTDGICQIIQQKIDKLSEVKNE